MQETEHRQSATTSVHAHTASTGTDGRRLDSSTCHLQLVTQEGLQDVIDSMSVAQQSDFRAAMEEDRHIQADNCWIMTSSDFDSDA
eukprot:805328-Rhodomonas_salina.2